MYCKIVCIQQNNIFLSIIMDYNFIHLDTIQNMPCHFQCTSKFQINFYIFVNSHNGLQPNTHLIRNTEQQLTMIFSSIFLEFFSSLCKFALMKIWRQHNKELLGKCERGKKIAPLWHKGQAEPKGCIFFLPLTHLPSNCIISTLFYSSTTEQFYCTPSTISAEILLRPFSTCTDKVKWKLLHS